MSTRTKIHSHRTQVFQPSQKVAVSKLKTMDQKDEVYESEKDYIMHESGKAVFSERSDVSARKEEPNRYEFT